MKTTPPPLFGSIEAGGTKFVLAAGNFPDRIVAEKTLRTRRPEETLDGVIKFFHDVESRHGPPAAFGVCCFGPVELRKDAPGYGHITKTPKENWSDTDILGPLAAAFSVPAGFDTDVNGAALGEARWGAARGLGSVLYVTVGTGIGGGMLAGGRPLHGLAHPEMGHIRVPHDTARDPFPGCCPYHGDCLEGLASGRAIELRWGREGRGLSDRPEVWELESRYLALGISNLILAFSPEIVILGGGVMEPGNLFPGIRKKVLEYLGGYCDSPRVTQGIETYIVPPGLGGRSGMAGGFVLAEEAWKRSHTCG